MGTGIGKYCVRCDNQLTYDDGFNYKQTLCRSCESIVTFDLKSAKEKEELL